MDGLLIVDKPAGMTSAAVVRVVKRRLQCKTGHLGTLDPFATGVLPVCVGEGTKIAQFLNEADKAYSGTIRLGTQTDTGDPTGSVTATAAVPPLTAAAVGEVARRFQGEIAQTPPMFSAIKRQGTPLYKLARRGIEVERTARRVRIDALRLEIVDAQTLAFAMDCSKGTYVRVLAEDLAAALGTVGHLATLRRTRFGWFAIDEAVTLDDVEAGAARVIGLREALRDVQEIRVDARGAQRARQGFEPLLAGLVSPADGSVAKLVGPEGELAAVIVRDAPGRWRFARVFAAPGPHL